MNNRFAASALLYGTPLLVPFPDLKRTRLLLMLGANPLVSHGSLLSSPRIREQLLDVERVVVDPRRTETARQFEHLPIRPDTDALLLLSMLAVIFEEELVDRVFVQRLGEGAGDLERMARTHPPEETEARRHPPHGCGGSHATSPRPKGRLPTGEQDRVSAASAPSCPSSSTR